MKRFLTLLKKEIRELITPQIILPLIITVLLFMFLGKVLGKEQTRLQNSKQDIVMVDYDNSATSALIVKTLEGKLNVRVEKAGKSDEIVRQARKNGKSAIIIVPEGFESNLRQLQPKKVEVYSVLRNFSFAGSKSYEVITTSLLAINEALSNQLISQQATGDPQKIKHPLATDDYVIIGEKQAKVNPVQVMGFVSAQTTFIPIILFMVIILSAQMIATAIATEKENKTLETLLTTPVSRNHLVIAKMAGAGIIALLSSVVYMFGFRYYMQGITGQTIGGNGGLGDAVSQLGLTLTPSNYVVLALSLFFGILAALAISLILGAFTEDVKSVASTTSPLMILVAIPYFLTMFLGIDSLSPAIKYLVYAIPFSHSFLAAPNLLLGNYSMIIYGILYQFLFFIAFAAIAARIFSSDLITTMKLNFGKKRAV